MFPREHHAAPDWRPALIERLAHVPREPAACCNALRLAAARVIRAWLYTYHRFGIVGRANLPTAGSFVMICNHSSHLDGLCLLAALPLSSLHRAYPAAAADYFFNSVPGSALSRLIINAVPFHRDASVRQSLGACRALLDDVDDDAGPTGNPGNVLILFPEGTRSTDGAVGPFRRGIGDLVAGSDVPVVPCHLDGAGAAWPKGTLLPRPRRLTLTIGAPRVYADAPRDKHVAQRIADELRDAVLRLGASHGPSHREDVYDAVCHH